MADQTRLINGHPYMPPRPRSGMPSMVEHVPTPAAPRKRMRKVVFGVGLLCILGGVGLVAAPLISVWQRGGADQSALNTWNSGGSKALAGAVAGTGGPVQHTCGSSSSTDYALVSFASPSQYAYVGVAGNGTWDLLHQRSMVHYDTTPAPGQQGNVIIAFHREPNYEHIDQLDVGGIVTVQDRACVTYKYKVSQRWSALDPAAVTQLGPTTGHELTLITCTPFWVDTQRMVWRAELLP